MGTQNSVLAETAPMRIAAVLRGRILDGELVLGQRLKIEEVAASMNSSTMPVREAFQILEAEGTVDIFPHRGAVVRSIDADFINNIYDMRGALNGMLSERSIMRGGDDFGDFVAEIRLLADEYALAAQSGDCARIIDADEALHGRIASQAGNSEAAKVLSRGVLLTRAIRQRAGYSGKFLKRTLADHEAILAAVERRDAPGAGKLQRRHCDAARDDLLALLARGQEGEGGKRAVEGALR